MRQEKESSERSKKGWLVAVLPLTVTGLVITGTIIGAELGADNEGNSARSPSPARENSEERELPWAPSARTAPERQALAKEPKLNDEGAEKTSKKEHLSTDQDLSGVAESFSSAALLSRSRNRDSEPSAETVRIVEDGSEDSADVEAGDKFMAELNTLRERDGYGRIDLPDMDTLVTDAEEEGNGSAPPDTAGGPEPIGPDPRHGELDPFLLEELDRYPAYDLGDGEEEANLSIPVEEQVGDPTGL